MIQKKKSSPDGTSACAIAVYRVFRIAMLGIVISRCGNMVLAGNTEKNNMTDSHQEKNVPSRIHASAEPMLMVDISNIDVNNGVGLTVCEADKYAENPILVPGPADAVDGEACQLGSVIYHDDKFRMWYMSVAKDNHRGFAYAESVDGLTWTKPILNRQAFKGSKENNLLAFPSYHIPFVMLDNEESDPAKRFKRAICTGSPKGGTGRAQLWSVAYSPDGLDWKLHGHPYPPSRWEDGEAQMLARQGDGWIVHTQGFSKSATTGKDNGRTCMGFTSDTLDTPVCEWQKNILFTLKDKYGAYQTHQGLSTWKHGRIVFGLTGIFCSRRELEDTSCDLALVLSHDGLKWTEPWPLATVIRRGPKGSWDSTFIIQAYPGVINVKDKTYIYYTGAAEGNTNPTKRIGVAMLRRDGFGYVATDISWSRNQPAPRTSDFTTIPVQLEDRSRNRICLNADNLSEDQYLKVELLNSAGDPIPGYTVTDADPMGNGGVAVPATWHGKASLESLTTDTIRVKVYLSGGQYREKSPRVYAVYFNELAEIEQ